MLTPPPLLRIRPSSSLRSLMCLNEDSELVLVLFWWSWLCVVHTSPDISRVQYTPACLIRSWSRYKPIWNFISMTPQWLTITSSYSRFVVHFRSRNLNSRQNLMILRRKQVWEDENVKKAASVPLRQPPFETRKVQLPLLKQEVCAVWIRELKHHPNKWWGTRNVTGMKFLILVLIFISERRAWWGGVRTAQQQTLIGRTFLIYSCSLMPPSTLL